MSTDTAADTDGTVPVTTNDLLFGPPDIDLCEGFAPRVRPQHNAAEPMDASA
ncbi:hypothetical protein [Streptomyces sp. NPDC002588]|uniref:hypothetical protein n=1 Tax=Streptomyces sp. NPDC002588 TaxID=3154419 RepID=UPI00332CFF38